MNSAKSYVNAVDASKELKKKVISIADGISFDAACSLLLSAKDVLKKSFKNGERISTSFCPKCCAPWIAGHYISRIISFPRNSKTIKILKRKEKLNRLPKKKQLLLSAFRTKSNIFKVTCRLCHHSVTNEFKLPIEKKNVSIGLSASLILPQESVTVVSKKKKKRKPKDKNAGLFLDPRFKQIAGVDSSFVPTSNDNKRNKINSLLSDSEKPSSSDSDEDEMRVVNTNNVNKIDSQNKQFKKRKALAVTSFIETVKEKGKKMSTTEKRICEKRKAKLKQILASSSTVAKQRPAGLASFLTSVFY